MLPELELDTEGFSNLFRKARSQIPELYPQWSNYNYHDPGITLLELFAFLTEAQQFYLDQLREDQSLAFLKLLGASPKPASPAQVWAEARSPQEVKIGQPFYTGDLCFQAREHRFLPGDLLVGLEIESPDGQTHQERFQTAAPGSSCYPFGAQAIQGTQFTLFFQEALEPNQDYHLSCLVEDRHSLPRNPIPPDYPFVPLATLRLSYFNGIAMEDLAFTDTSHGFLQDGAFCFALPTPMMPQPEGSLSPYFLQFTLVESQYDTPPVIFRLSCGDLLLQQEETLALFCAKEALVHHHQEGKEALYFTQENQNLGQNLGQNLDQNLRQVPPEEGDWVVLYRQDLFPGGVLAQGNGFPSQRYRLSTQGILPLSVKIYVEEEGVPGLYAPYSYVADFATSTPESRHFTLDFATGEVVFGDGFAGYPPESQIMLLGLTVSQGPGGNLGKGTSLQSRDQAQQLVTVQDGKGGQEAQSLQECFAQVQASLDQPTRLVSLQDIKTIVQETPGLRIQDCILKPPGEADTLHPNLLHLVVKPFGGDCPTLTPAYEENILQHLQDKRLVGTYLRLHAPTYVTVDLYVEVYAHPQFGRITEGLHRLLQAHFAELTTFGVTIAYHQLYHLVEREPGVSRIGELSLLTKGEGVTRKSNGDVVLPPHAIGSLGQVRCVILNS